MRSLPAKGERQHPARLRSPLTLLLLLSLTCDRRQFLLAPSGTASALTTGNRLEFNRRGGLYKVTCALEALRTCCGGRYLSESPLNRVRAAELELN